MEKAALKWEITTGKAWVAKPSEGVEYIVVERIDDKGWTAQCYCNGVIDDLQLIGSLEEAKATCERHRIEEFYLPEPVPDEVLMVVSMSQLIAMLHAGKPAIRAIEKLPMFPIAMVLHCPECHMQHIDGIEARDTQAPGWNNPPHKTHLCAHCGCRWRPADVPTTGVEAVATRGKHDTWPK